MAEIMLEIAKIRRDGGTQSRQYTDTTTVDSYAEDMKGGAQFPAITVFFDGNEYWLADGFHRVQAAQKANKSEILADAIEGTQRDAVLHSTGVNTNHGLRRTNLDKRMAIRRLLIDDEWSQWSNREIARRTGTTDPTVAQVRKAIEEERRQEEERQRLLEERKRTIAEQSASENPTQNGKKPSFSEVFSSWRNTISESEIPVIERSAETHIVITSYAAPEGQRLEDFHLARTYCNFDETNWMSGGYASAVVMDKAFVDFLATKFPMRYFPFEKLPPAIKAIVVQIKPQDQELNRFDERPRADYFDKGQLVLIKDGHIGIIKNFKARSGVWNVETLQKGRDYPETRDFRQGNLTPVDTTLSPEAAVLEDDMLKWLDQLWHTEQNDAAFQQSALKIAKRCYEMLWRKKGKKNGNGLATTEAEAAPASEAVTE